MATTKTLTPTNQTITIDAFQGEKPDHRHVADAETKLADAVNALNSKLAEQIGTDTKWISVPASGSITATMSSRGLWLFYRVYRPTIVFIRTNGNVELVVGESQDLTFSLSSSTLTITNPATWAINCWVLG